MKLALVILTLIALPAQAAPWNADCVTWYGGDIPKEERTKENCPTGRNHWDTSSPGVVSDATVVSNTTVNTPWGGYNVGRVGNTVTVIQTSKSR